jgi:hypothetical protein
MEKLRILRQLLLIGTVMPFIQAATIINKQTKPFNVTSFDGPYQSSPQPENLKDELWNTLDKINLLPAVILHIVTSYFFYRTTEGITLYQSQATEKLTDRFRPKKNGLVIPYSLLIIHSNKSSIIGNELLASAERTIGLPHTLFTLQEWAYRKNSNEEENRNHTIIASDTYQCATIGRYTFGIEIPRDKEWSAQEMLARKTLKRKTRARCIIA